MNSPGVLQQLDDLIQARSILCHPFYLAWQRGELTREQLATYAAVYYPHVAGFTSHLVSAISSAEDPVVRAELKRNLDDELTQPAPHHEMWLDFAEGLGLDRAAVASAVPHPAAVAMVMTFERLAARDTASALAALYAYESQQPEVSREKADGLRRHYGMQNPSSLAYFDVHATTDLQHRQGERHALERCIEAGTPGSVLLSAAEEALVAYWKLLDGACEAARVS